ncbi:MAG: sulfide-dependent adenosine diphosphate thiazole synthase [Planctomycetes bacterium]|nr:sulfide-dependent adenosine diphosphate thiazole synthase [Planctomycetota bacterium]
MRTNAVFSPVSDADVTRAILRSFSAELEEYISSDAIVVGAGPAGLICARELARKGLRVLLIERNNYLGGGFWIGGFLMNKLTVRAPAHTELIEFGVRLTEAKDGLFVTDAPWACSKLIASACDAGVKVLSMTTVDDVVLKNGRVCGAVVNWTPVGALPRQITCVDPVSFEAGVVVDATGHDAAVAEKLARRGLIKLAGMGPMDADSSEDAIVEQTGEVFPGLIACGMSVSTVHGLPRMGPTFGGMLLSGRRAAELAASVVSPAREAKPEPALV